MLIKANIWVYVFQLVVMKVTYAVYGLDSVHIRVPQAVALGSSAVLICECDLPDEDLYSVKWYKGKHEFFRYTSKEIPSIKIFPKAGINVNVDHSNASHVILGNVEPHTSGKYSCEVTEAAPSFHTKIVTRDLNVVDLPKSDPVIVDMKPYYGADEFLEVECISNESLPAARLEWLINDQPLGVIQPPSRLEFLTLPAAVANATSGSGSSSNGTDGSTSTVAATSSKKSTKSSLRHKSDEESSDLTNSLEGGGGELAVPLAMVASAAAALSLTTSSTSTGSVLPSPAAIHAGSSSGKSGGGKKALVNSRYERSVARLKLLLGHEHFEEGKIKVKCIARIFDVYERTAVQVADENYPQVRVLSKSDNGVHYSFMSDKDEASSKASSSSSSQLSRPHHRWSSMVLRPVLSWLAGKTATTTSEITGQSQLQYTGQSWTSQLLGGTALAAFLLSWNAGASELLIALPMATMLLLF